ncbi:unnamed protein product [Nesidiocoris tenuis]|uniref:Uncharacterized protein n=1 Tax=Nesidiocoris tenuis TaxID=355587 RepID=A0A6H5G040_9HEMI|nr:unnamed protein product [Nesidiocoris tenuis]
MSYHHVSNSRFHQPRIKLGFSRSLKSTLILTFERLPLIIQGSGFTRGGETQFFHILRITANQDPNPRGEIGHKTIRDLAHKPLESSMDQILNDDATRLKNGLKKVENASALFRNGSVLAARFLLNAALYWRLEDFLRLKTELAACPQHPSETEMALFTNNSLRRSTFCSTNCFKITAPRGVKVGGSPARSARLERKAVTSRDEGYRPIV